MTDLKAELLKALKFLANVVQFGVKVSGRKVEQERRIMSLCNVFMLINEWKAYAL